MYYKLTVKYVVSGDELDAKAVNGSIQRLINSTLPYMVDSVVVDLEEV